MRTFCAPAGRAGPSRSFMAAACLVSAMVLYGASFMAMKVALGALDPWLIVFARLSLAFAVLAVLAGRAAPAAASVVGRLPALLAMALCEPCLYFVFEARALTLTSSAQAGMITALLPVMVAAGAHFTHGERLTRRQALGLVLGLAGAAGLGAGGAPQPGSPNPLLGNLLELLAMVCATAYTLLVKSLARHFSSLFLTAFQAGTGALFFLPALAFRPWPDHLDLSALAAVGFLGLVVSAGAYLLYNHSLARLPATRVGAAANLIPAFALLFGWVFLGEELAGAQWLFLGLILAGSALAAGSP